MVISGLAEGTGPEAAVIVAGRPIPVLSSAVHGGGLASARAVVNLDAGKDDPSADPAEMLAACAHGAGLPEAFIGLLTGAWTEHARVGEEDGAGIPALAVATVGLSNRIAVTSTDAVVIAATGRGASARFGGPATEFGWSIAQAARRALWAGIRGWQERNG